MAISQQLNKILRKHDLRFKAIADKVVSETKEILVKRLNDDFYKSYSPLDYERSYDLINAVQGRVIKNGVADYTIEVYFDEAQIHPRSRAGWNAHMGFDGKPFTHGLVESLEDGFKSPYSPRHGKAFRILSKTKSEAEKIANKLLKQYLK